MTTVSGENCILRASRGFVGSACVPACSIAAKAGNDVAAAEAAPRIRINDLRETLCVLFEFMEVLLEGLV
jgi:hypothetical protein